MSINRIGNHSATAIVIGVLAVSVSGVGIAAAGNGGSLRLGHHNSATKTTKLSDSKGTPLSLKAGHGKPPLAVNSSKQVKHLNASLLGGSSASSLQTSGSHAETDYPPNKIGNVATTATPVVATAKLTKGLYYVTADAFVDNSPTSNAVYCLLTRFNYAGSDNVFGTVGTTAEGFQTITDTAAIIVKAGDRVTYYCMSSPGDTTLFNADLTAIRVDSSTRGTHAPGKVEAFVRKGQDR